MAKLEPVSSVQDQAEAAKQKGNEHFKKKEYAESIGCYSHAHILLPSSPIYPLNRAQAYINLSKFSDAERDCSTSISLDPKNPKAWFRRGIARRSLANWAGSRADFSQVLALDRSMEAGVKAELEKVELAEKAEREKAKSKQKRVPVVSPPKVSSESSSSSSSSSPPTPTPAKPIAIPIKMTYPTSEPSMTDKPSVPLTSPGQTKLASSPAPSARPPVSSGSSSQKDPTAAIFPSFPSRSKPKAGTEPARDTAGSAGFSALKAARTSKGIIPKAAGPTGLEEEEELPRPESVHSLVKALKALDERRSWLMLKNMPLSRLPTLVGSSLEPPLLEHLFVLLENDKDDGSRDPTTKKELAERLGSLKRFGLNMCMLERGSERWKKIQETYGV